MTGRLISFGGLLADLVLRVDAVPERGEDALARDFIQSVGGGFAVVVAAARLGVPTALAGALGDDPFADTARRVLAEEGIELLFPEPRPGSSGLCLVLVDAGGERTMVTVEGVESRLRAADLATVTPSAGDFVYLSGYELLYEHGPALADWVERTRPHNLVFDPGPLVAKIEVGTLSSVLAATRWLSLNAAEAGALAEAGVDVDAVAGIVVRAGADGCVLHERGRETRAIPAFPVEAVDTTSAGDAHVGAFIAALAHGVDSYEACRWGNAAASFVVATRGQASPPRSAELRERLGG